MKSLSHKLLILFLGLARSTFLEDMVLRCDVESVETTEMRRIILTKVVTEFVVYSGTCQNSNDR